MTTAQAIELAEQHLNASRYPAAEQLARQVLSGEPNNVDALGVLGVVAFESGRLDVARELFERAVRQTASPSAINCFRLGETFRHLVQLEPAIDWLDRAVRILPGDADAHLSLALALMTVGEYERGFDEFEWRWRTAKLNTQRIQFAQPTWDGSDPAGKKILLWAEQGLGDVLQVIRYAPLLAARGATVFVGCQQPLERLFQSLKGVSIAISAFDRTPAFDLQIPTYSLMRAFGTTFSTIPQNVPYLFAESSLVEQWKNRLAADRARLKVGIVWGGNPTNPHDAARSIPVTALAPLAKLKDASFYSLQVGPRAAEAAAAPREMQIKSLGSELTDFADTAAVLKNLDLFITIDSAPAHLAGALGVRTWVVLSHYCDWRWMIDRTDCPWYPTMKLFRQQRRGDWNQVMNDVAAALAAELGQSTIS